MRSNLKTGISAGIVLLGLVATLIIDPDAADIWLAGVGGLLGVLGSDALYRKGWRFGLLLFFFVVQIGLAITFTFLLGPLGEHGQELARTYLIAAVAGIVGLASWLTEIAIDK